MSIEGANKYMGFFSIIKEACRISYTWKKIFSQIAIVVLLPLAALYLNEIQIINFIETNNHSENARRVALGITEFIYALLLLFFTLYSTSIVVYTVACFYTSQDITLKNVSSAFSKVWGRLIVTSLWYLLIMVIYFGVAIGLLVLIESTTKVIYFIGLIYITIIYNMATVVCVLENDYGRKAFKRSMKLIKCKIWASFFIYLVLDIAFAGILIVYALMVYGTRLSVGTKVAIDVYGNKLGLVGKIFVGIGCYLLMAMFLHFYFVIQTVIYFKCKSHHNENISESDVAHHLEDSYVQLVKVENGAVDRVSV
ncbi:hypothetical protein MKX01_003374 [Papaver californicum]|nr:hypothetical protein MKX01_003374 [Papaver californicum]